MILLIKQIMNLFFGYKYKVVIVKDRGVERYWISSYIFADNAEGNKRLQEYVSTLENSVNACTFHQIVSFRSRNEYAEYLAEKIAIENDVLKKQIKL